MMTELKNYQHVKELSSSAFVFNIDYFIVKEKITDSFGNQIA